MKLTALTIILITNILFIGYSNQKQLNNDHSADLSSTENSPTERLRSVYLSEVGVREATNRNDGTKVEEYLRYTGLKRGNPWCCAFVCYCLGKAGIPNPRTGYCPNLFPKGHVIWSRTSGFSLPSPVSRNSSPITRNSSPNPSPGDIFGLYFPDKGRIAHVGFIDDWGEKYLISVEGNTNEAGSREGDGIYRKRRLISSISKVARYLPDQ